MMRSVLSALILYLHMYVVLASVGDRSFYHQTCLKTCWEAFCNSRAAPSTVRRARETLSFQINSSVYLKYLGWSCDDECKYQCMWRTVDYFVEIEKRQTVPQFYGKWPFVRIYGKLYVIEYHELNDDILQRSCLSIQLHNLF